MTGVGGGQWYRFGGSWDSLPTNPGGFNAGTPGFRGPQFCDAAASAWVSGWPADETDDPPPDYAVPGSLPGDGPQYPDAQWDITHADCGCDGNFIAHYNAGTWVKT